MDLRKLRKYRGRRAVSPVVATLILIIVAIVGAVSVGLIMSGIATSTGKSASGSGALTNSQGQLYIGGSARVYSILLDAQPAFQAQTGIQLVLSQGGSDAGMQGVLSGALDIGMAGSASSVQNLENAVASESLVSVQVNPILIGGSTVVITENGAGTNGLLADNGGNECLGISQDALSAIFQIGTFGIESGACAGGSPLFQTLQLPDEGATAATTVCSLNGTPTVTVADGSSFTFPACGAGVLPVSAVSRSDSSGAQDQLSLYLNGHPAKQSVSGNWAGITESGDAGVINYVNTHGATSTSAGSIGFDDLGTAEGATNGVICPSGHAAQTTCNVGIPQVFTSTKGSAASTAVPVVMTSSAIGFVGRTASTSTVGAEAQSKTALRDANKGNPLTGVGVVAYYPDSKAPGSGLASLFYLVTNGPPNAIQQKLISFITSYNAESDFTNNGYYSQYDFTSA